MISTFLPMGAVTGIGSLPFHEASEAIEFVERFSAGIPFVPELPSRSPSEGLIERALAPLAHRLEKQSACHFELVSRDLDLFLDELCACEAEIPYSHCAGIYDLETALEEGKFKHALGIKAQLVGPITLALSIKARGRPVIKYRAIVKELAAYLARLAVWQINRLRRFDLPILFFLDEPCLELGDPQTIHLLADLLSRIRQPDVLVGLHTCALGVFEKALVLKPQILSFDAHSELEEFFASPRAREYLDSGGLFALGLVPTLDDLSPVSATGQFFRFLSNAQGVESARAMARQSLITATCGLASLSKESSAASFKLAHEISELVELTALA